MPDNRQFHAVLIPQIIIAVIFCMVFAGAVYFTFANEIAWSDTQEKVAMYLLGILSAALMTIINYFFSSSLGSKIKEFFPKTSGV